MKCFPYLLFTCPLARCHISTIPGLEGQCGVRTVTIKRRDLTRDVPLAPSALVCGEYNILSCRAEDDSLPSMHVHFSATVLST